MRGETENTLRMALEPAGFREGLLMNTSSTEPPPIGLPHTPVNEGYVSRRLMRRLQTSGPRFMLPVARERNTVEALKPVPHVGTFWGGWSQWRNRLPQER